jgi:hypothetical protein
VINTVVVWLHILGLCWCLCDEQNKKIYKSKWEKMVNSVIQCNKIISFHFITVYSHLHFYIQPYDGYTYEWKSESKVPNFIATK